MEMLRVDAWDEKKCVHASTLETGLMHGAERQELVHHFLEARAGRRGAGDARRLEARKVTEDSGRRSQREGFWSMGSGVEPADCQGSRAAIYSS